MSLNQAEASLRAHLEEVNKINVFPVADNDTGTNLYNTIRGAASTLCPTLTINEAIKQYAHALFLKASGNSGMMLSMLVSRFATLLDEANDISEKEYLQILHLACLQTKEDIDNFQAGTLISYLEESIAELLANEEGLSNNDESIQRLLEQSLEKTATDNPFLSDKKLVDAGALGLHHYLMGMLYPSTLCKPVFNEPDDVLTDERSQSCQHSFESEAPNYRYCVQATLELSGKESAHLKAVLSEAGDCSLSLFQDKQCRFHVHSDEPKPLFVKLMSFAVVSDIKIEDMHRQYLAANSLQPIALVCDSSVNLPPGLSNSQLVHTIPITITQGSQVMLDGLSIDSASLMSRIKTLSDYPKTASPSFGVVDRAFSWLSKQYEQVLVLSVSAAMSATYKTFSQVANAYSNITVIDSKKNSGAQGLMAAMMAERIEKGHDASTILALMDKIRQACEIFVLVNDFKAMIRSGRISRGKALFAKAINLKPIVGIDSAGNGKVIAKTISCEKQQARLIELIQKRYEAKGIKRFFILHSGNVEEAKALSSQLESALKVASLGIAEVSTSIQLHAGKGALAVAIEGEL
jgi:DegV family protein with EDD domain